MSLINTDLGVLCICFQEFNGTYRMGGNEHHIIPVFLSICEYVVCILTIQSFIQNANENSHSALSKLNTMATCEHFSLTMECKQFILQLTSEKEPTEISMHTNIPDVKVQQLVQYPQQVEQPVIISDNDTAAPTTM